MLRWAAGSNLRAVSAVIVATVCLSAVMVTESATSSWAAGCPNEQIRLEQEYASTLPDCRAYEQVSPSQKNLADARGAIDEVQVSPSGESATFYSIIPFPGVLGSTEFPLYLSTRSNAPRRKNGQWLALNLRRPLTLDPQW